MLRFIAPALLAGLSLTAANAATQDVSLAAGHRLASTICGRCHAVDKVGDSPNPRAPRFRQLGANFPFDGLQDALMSGMIVGHPQMPIIHLSPVEAGDVVAYLKTLQPPGRAEPQRPRRQPLPLQETP